MALKRVKVVLQRPILRANKRKQQAHDEFGIVICGAAYYWGCSR